MDTVPISKRHILGSVAVNTGLDRADVVRTAGPDGAVTVVAISRTQRMADRLLDQGRLDARQHGAATQLRDLWERAGLAVANLRTRDLVWVDRGEFEWLADDAAFHRYTLAMRQMGREGRRILQDVVIADMDPDAWGRRVRCHGITMLRHQLDRLARWWSL